MKVEWTDTEFIRGFEGFKLEAYLDIAGIWTCGFGCTGEDITEGTIWTEEYAKKRFMEEIDKFCLKLDKCLPVNIPKNKYVACLSLAYNIGMGSFNASTLLKYLKTFDYGSAASEFTKWSYVTQRGKKVFSKGLQERRKQERDLFLKP